MIKLRLGILACVFAFTTPNWADCRDDLEPTLFDKLEVGDVREGDVYFPGTEAERDAHAEEMGAAGRLAARKLMLAHSIPPGPVLEIGPFLRPLARELTPEHAWIVWEYDRAAAQRIADTGDATVYRVDLNRLAENDWKDFLAAQANQPFAAVVLSSVLNYVDRIVVLDQVMANVADGALVVIANSNVGDRARWHGGTAPNGGQILEELLVRYPDRIKLLEGTRLTLDSFDGNRSGIALAFRAHRSRRGNVDLYEEGLGLLADYWAKPFSVKYPGEDSRDYIDFWYSDDPEIVAQAREDIRVKRKDSCPWLKTNRRATIESVVAKMKAIVDSVIAIGPDDPGFDKLRQELRSPAREQFLPERHVLLAALDRPRTERRAYVVEKRSQLLRTLGHPTDE